MSSLSFSACDLLRPARTRPVASTTRDTPISSRLTGSIRTITRPSTTLRSINCESNSTRRTQSSVSRPTRSGPRLTFSLSDD